MAWTVPKMEAMEMLVHNPKKPLNSFWFHMNLLRLVGLWAPEDKKWARFYWMYSNFCVVFWVMLFLLTQVLFFVTVSSVGEVADACFFFLNELMLLPKLYYYRKNNDRIKKVVKTLESPRFLPRNEMEEMFVYTAMKRTTFFHRLLLSLTYPTIVMWAVSAYVGHKQHTGKDFVIPANFPFNTGNSVLYYMALFYQTIAMFYTGTTHMTTDTLATGLVFHAASQVEILGDRISKVGYSEPDEVEKEKSSKTARKSFYDKQHYNDLLAQIQHHKEILEYCKELQLIFKESLFVQLITTCFILCMTELQMVVLLKHGLILFIISLPYFIILTLQIYMLCYTGNELTFASKSLLYNSFKSNFMTFDKRTVKALLMFMEKAKRDIGIDAQAVFKITLNIHNFISIMRASYSVFALLQTMQ